MKILIIDNAAMVTKNGRTCTNRFNGTFLEELEKEGNTVSYMQFVNNSSNSISEYDLEQNGIRCVPIKRSRIKILSYIFAFFKSFHEILKNDFVYIYIPNTLSFVYIICHLFNKKYGLYVRGMKGLEGRRSVKLYKRSTVVFTVSDAFSLIIKNYCTHNRVFTIKPMIPYSDADIIEIRDHNTPHIFSLLFLGRIAYDKGIEELIRAIYELREQGYSNVLLNIVGDGEFYHQAEELINELHLNDVVYLKGSIVDDKEKMKCFTDADLYVLPTYHEGFPRTLYEAMIFGTPIITTFVGGIPALMQDKVNCLRIEPKSVDSIVKGLIFAINNYELMCQCAANARETVRPIIDRNRPTHAQHLNQVITNIK